MTERLYTLKEMAERLNYLGYKSDHQKIMRQIRHWTLSDLLQAEGKKHTGTGVSRRYRFFQLQKAAILRELSHYGIAISNLIDFGEWLDDIASDEKWRWAEEGERTVFVEIGWGDQFIVCRIMPDKPGIADSIADEEERLKSLQEKSSGTQLIYYSSVVVNLTRLLHRLGAE